MSDQSHNHMKFVKGKNTRIEVQLCHALWHAGIRYRKNVKTLPGKPDIVINKYKVVIFCDGDFWHGYDLKNLRIHSNKKFWIEKINRNMRRDEEITYKLETMGWKVIRFWEHEIKKDLPGCVQYVKEVIWENKIENNEV